MVSPGHTTTQKSIVLMAFTHLAQLPPVRGPGEQGDGRRPARARAPIVHH